MRMRLLMFNGLWFTVVLLARVQAQEVTTQPNRDGGPTLPPPTQRAQRLNDLARILESQIPPDTRRTVARELLLQPWPEKSARVVAILGGSNPGARTAIAAALVQTPEALEQEFVEPLLAMLGDVDSAVREAAAGALASYADPPRRAVTARLRQLARAAIRALRA